MISFFRIIWNKQVADKDEWRRLGEALSFSGLKDADDDDDDFLNTTNYIFYELKKIYVLVVLG